MTLHLHLRRCRRYRYATHIGAINAAVSEYTDHWWCHECKAFHVGHRPWIRRAA